MKNKIKTLNEKRSVFINPFTQMPTDKFIYSEEDVSKEMMSKAIELVKQARDSF